MNPLVFFVHEGIPIWFVERDSKDYPRVYSKPDGNVNDAGLFLVYTEREGADWRRLHTEILIEKVRGHLESQKRGILFTISEGGLESDDATLKIHTDNTIRMSTYYTHRTVWAEVWIELTPRFIQARVSGVVSKARASVS